MAFKFPFTNYHELNLTWVLEQLKKLFEESEENVETIETYDNRLSAVESEVSTLETTTSQAIHTANAAATNAATALSRANTANENALTASSQAGAATVAAQDALQEAQTATQTAQQAQATAMTFDGRITQAQNDASAAVHEAESFENRVNAAINTAQAADAKAEVADAKAEDAAESVEESAAQIAQNTQDISDVKNDTSGMEAALGKTNIGNLIMEATPGKAYRYNSGSGEIYTQDNASYMCAVIDVSALSFVSSTVNFGSTNFQFFGTDTAFVATGSSQRTSDPGYIFSVPQGATKLYLSFQKTTWDIAVCAGRDSITSKTIADLPIGGTYTYTEVNILNDKVDEVYKTVLTTTSRNVQYLDNSAVTNGYYWSGTTKVENASYRAFDPISVPAGTYYISTSASANFTYVEISGVTTKLSTFNLITIQEYACYCVEFEYDITLYVSASYPSSYKVAVSTIPIKPNDEEYVFGEFLESPYKVIRVGSTRPYKTLKSALEAVEKVFDAYVYVDAEEFDLVQEFGQSFLDSYSTTASFGLILKNRVHLIFAAGSKVVFNYTGSNPIVHEWFSPFNAGRYGFELIGANIESTNCRYSVHDEHGTENEPYNNIYKGCTMVHDSTGTSWGAHQCIGGGLGLHGTIDIEDCNFKSIGETVDASYHAPNTSANASSRVSVRNCYFNGTFRMTKTGTGTTKSRGFVSGNSMATSPYVSANTGAADNVDMIEWNNVIRS